MRIFGQVGILGIKNIGRFAYKCESKVRVPAFSLTNVSIHFK